MKNIVLQFTKQIKQQRLYYPHEETLHPWLSKMCPVSILIRLRVGVVGSGNGVVYLTSPGRTTEIGLQLGKACYPCSR